MPVTIPILKEGSSEIVVIPGVKRNGQSSDRSINPFYRSYVTTLDLIPARVDTIKPKVKYRDAKFVWIEDFEDNTISLERTLEVSTTDSFIITREPAEVFNYDGNLNTASGKIIIPANGLQVFDSRSIEVFDLPRQGQEIFLELNFASNTNFTVGIYPIRSGQLSGNPIVNFFSTEDEEGKMVWKKAYVSLKEDVNSAFNIGADFRVFFNAQTNSTDKVPIILLDNIKLIHF